MMIVVQSSNRGQGVEIVLMSVVREMIDILHIVSVMKNIFLIRTYDIMNKFTHVLK